MTKKTSCHLPFNVERGELGTRKGKGIKTQILDQLTLCIFGQMTIILTVTCGWVDEKLCNKWSSVRDFAEDESTLGS